MFGCKISFFNTAHFALDCEVHSGDVIIDQTLEDPGHLGFTPLTLQAEALEGIIYHLVPY